MEGKRLPRFVDRIVRAARLDPSLFEEVEADEDSLGQAIAAVLLFGLAGGIGSAFLMSRFEDQLHRLLALAFFVPVITAMGGNVGIQCSSIVVRALALGEMEAYRIGRRVGREFLVASFNGVILACLVSVVAVP